jgi:uncharacterized membrane protein YbhN (UPF0104 family)
MQSLLDAFEAFVDYLGSIAYGALGLALLCHLGKIAARTRAWRNIVAAAYPDADVRWRTILGGYVAGVGVNAIVPARGGDVLKLYLVRRGIPGATYPTLAATLLAETLFDVVVSSVLLSWALATGVLPGRDVLPRLPEIDWLYLFQHPRVAALVGVLAGLAVAALAVLARRRIRDLRARVALGFAIFRPPRCYLRRVVPWQALDWGLRLATLYFFLRAFGLHAGLERALRVQVTQSLATILPLTPGGIGTEQALLLYVSRGEAAAATVLSFSVGMRLVLTLANVILAAAAIALMLRTLRFRRAVEAAQAEGRASGAPEAR